MSVQQENITAAMSPSATTLLVHITALVRRGMLETDETAQASLFTIRPFGGEKYFLMTSELTNQNT